MTNDLGSPSNPHRVKYGQPNSAAAYEIRDFLNRSVVEFEWIELVSDEDCDRLRHSEADRDPFFLETSVPGSFAAGDVRHGSVKRVASAVGEGAMAVTFVHKYLEELG